jgi:hypothetical protein
MQLENDVDLEAAINGPALSIRPLLEFDFARDNTWSGAYANQSALMSNVDTDFASIHGDLPSEINSVVGSSSGLMTVKLSGYSATAGLDVTQLWSKYYSASPLFTTKKEGTPIRYSRIVSTAAGPRTLRQFTGWISEYVIDEAAGVVTLTCSDVYDLQTALVSLPVWARGPDIGAGGDAGPSGYISTMTCIDAAWVYKYILQSSGRSIWPMPRIDAVAMWPCDGAMLPTVGEIGTAVDGITIQAQYAALGDISLPYAASGAPYGLVPFGSDSPGGNDTITAGFAHATRAVYVPDRGGVDTSTAYIGFAGWFKSQYDGVTSPTFANPTYSMFVLGNDPGDGYLLVKVYPFGGFQLTLFESSSSGTSNAGTSREYAWVSSTNAIPAGWHYLEVWMTFTRTSISASARIDGATKAATSGPLDTNGFKYYRALKFESQTNPCSLFVYDTPLQHFQVYNGSGAPAFQPLQKDPPYVVAGKTIPARTSSGTNWLTHIPDRYNKYGWDVLKEAVEGELGVMMTREDGSLWIMGREDAYLYGWLPTVGGNLSLVIQQFIEAGLDASWLGVNSDLMPSKSVDLSRAKISGVQYNPSADTFRNAISYHVDLTKMINAIVWSSSDPKQFYAPSGSTNLDKIIGLPSGTVSIYNNTVDTGITPNANKPPLDQTSISAIQANFPTFAASAGWLSSVFWKSGQRSFDFGYGAGILSPGPVYVGTAAGGDQANFQIGGWKYDNSDPFDEIWYRAVGPDSVAERGFVLLDLGSNDWRQYPPRLRKIFDGLLRDTIAAVPVMRNLSVPTDPRRQLLDVVKLPPSRIVSGDVYAQVVGKRISDTQDSAQDYIDVRALVGPVETAYWDVSNWDQGSWTL